MKLPRPKEASVQAQVLAYLRLCGCLPVRVNSGALYGGTTAAGKKRFVRFNSEPGCSDVLACVPVPGRPAVFVAIEVKRPGEHATPEQSLFLERVRAAGGAAAVVRSVEDVRDVLRSLGAYAA